MKLFKNCSLVIINYKNKIFSYNNLLIQKSNNKFNVNKIKKL